MDERAILCFGDSNTWGCPPDGDGEARYGREVRWPGVLQALLGAGYHVIEEGLNGRTATLEHPFVEGRNGRQYLLPCCRTHAPLDLVIIYLGTNDLADHYQLSPLEIAGACASLVRVVAYAECGRDAATAPPVLLVCPPPIEATGPNASVFATASVKSRELGDRFAECASVVGAELLDLGTVLRYSEDDPIHLDVAGHRALAEAVAPIVRRLAAPPLDG